MIMDVHDIKSKYKKVVSANFNNLNVFDFKGVYIIYDDEDNIVYIGSAYTRTIQTRLKQYLKSYDTGNTLGKTIAKQLSGSSTYDKNAKERIKEAIEIIKTYNIYAIPYEDLEYKLIRNFKPKYNNCGKGED